MKVVVQNIGAIDEIIKDIQDMQERMDNGLMAAANAMTQETKSRIQNGGQATNGSRLVTKSKKRVGAYSEAWGAERASHGLQTAHVDLTFTGDMMDSYDSAKTGKQSAIIGFESVEESSKAGKMESLYGTPIFDVADNVIDKQMDIYADIVIGK